MHVTNLQSVKPECRTGFSPIMLCKQDLTALFRLDGTRGRKVGRGCAAFESPAAIFAHKSVVVMAALVDHGFFVWTWNYKGPSRPCHGGVAVHVDFKVR